MKEKITAYMNVHREELVRDVCRLVRIRSDRGEAKEGAPFGEGPLRALNDAMELTRGMGFAVTNYDNYVMTADLGGEEPGLDILAHLDVVPVSDSWTVTQPFEPLVLDGRIYGRGTADDKGPAVAALYAMKAVKDLGIPLKKRVRLILGTDEECGSSDLEHYYAREEEAPASVSPDADFPIINLEKGGLRGVMTASYEESGALPRLVSAEGGTKLNVVPDKSFALVEGMDAEALSGFCRKAGEETGAAFTVSEENGLLRIDVKGHGAHASQPEGGCNAVTALLRLIAELPLADCDGLRRLKAVEKLFPHGDWSGKAAGVAMKDDLSGATTLSFDILHYGLTGFRGEFDCRASILANDGNLRDVIREELAQEGVTLEPCAVYAPHYVPAETPLVQTLLRCYEKYTGEKGRCIAIGGGTYVHHLKNGVAFGCARDGVDNRMHGDDEFAEIDQLLLSAAIYAQAIADICG